MMDDEIGTRGIADPHSPLSLQALDDREGMGKRAFPPQGVGASV
jgi:hypothetical protein